MKKFLVAITTYEDAPCVELNICLYKKYKACDIIVLDDHSNDKQLQEVCKKYDVPLLINEKRYGHQCGDLYMTAKAIEYAYQNNYEYVLKCSKKFMCMANPFISLEKLIQQSHGYTFTSVCLQCNFQTRTQFVCFKSNAWINFVNKMKQDAQNYNFSFVQQYLPILCKQCEPKNDDVYIDYQKTKSHMLNKHIVYWSLIGDMKNHTPNYILWRHKNNAKDYHNLSLFFNLPYTEEDFIIKPRGKDFIE